MNSLEQSLTRIVLLTFPMHRVRRTLIAAVLVLYAAQVVGGRSMHLWQCSSCDDSHCSWHQHSGSHCCGQSSDCCKFHHASDETKQHKDKRPAHESSSCWVCQVLGQAQAKSLELEVTGSFRSPPEPAVAFFSRLFPVASACYFSRGPPASFA